MHDTLWRMKNDLSKDVLTTLAARITRTLFATVSLSSAGLIATFTVLSIVGAELSGNPLWAGVPATLHLLGKAGAAYLWGPILDRFGRRVGLQWALLAGLGGAALAVYSIMARSFSIFLGGLVLMGVARAVLDLSRFFAAEVHAPAVRGKAVSRVVIAGTVGAVFGPLLVGPTGAWAERLGLQDLSGTFVAASLLFALATVVVAVGLRPDPRDLGRKVADLYPDESLQSGQDRPLMQILLQPTVVVAVVAMVFSQVVMVMLMVITSLHMRENQHALSNISIVVSAHTLGMYAFSLVTGWLVDSWGRGPVILTGAGILILSGLMAPLSVQLIPLAVSLFLLGLGWNFCYVGGSTLLSDQLSPTERSQTQGFNDLLIGLVSAAGSFGSGVVYASAGFAVMGLVAAALSLLPLFLTARWSRRQRRLAEASG